MAGIGHKPKRFKPSVGTGTRRFSMTSHLDAMYDSDWERYSREFLAVNKLCYSCGAKSEAVDHIRPHKGDWALFRQGDNHLPLCHKCHNTITGLFDRHREPRTEAKLKWLYANRVRNSVTVRVKVVPWGK